MGYYLGWGLALYLLLVVVFRFVLRRKFPGSNLLFFGVFLVIYYGMMIQALISSLYVYHNGHSIWTNGAMNLLGVRLVELAGSAKVENKGRRTLYLFNHRSIFDFNVHDAICEYDANYLSSETVSYFLPTTYFLTRWLNSVFFFKRGGRGDRLSPFFAWLDTQFVHPMLIKPGLIFYGEGHRNPRPDPLPLKRGMIRYSFERAIPIQMIMAFGVENVIAEKELRVERTKTVRYFRYPLIHPDRFPSAQAYHDHIQALFSERFYAIKQRCAA